MAKKASKKKVNRKLRRTVRKTLSAVFMITALVVAAIPVQDNVLASSTTTPGTGGTTTTTPAEEPYTDPYDVTAADYNAALGVARPTGGTEQKGQTIDWDNQFFRISEAYKVENSSNGLVITGFNADYKPSNQNSLTISSYVTVGYILKDMAVTEQEITAMYMDTTVTPNVLDIGNAGMIAEQYTRYANASKVDISQDYYAVENTEIKTNPDGTTTEVGLGTYRIDFYKYADRGPDYEPGGRYFDNNTVHSYATKVYAVQQGGGPRSNDFGWTLEEVIEVNNDGSLTHKYGLRNREIGKQWAAIMEADEEPDDKPDIHTDQNGFKVSENLFVSGIADKAFVKQSEGGGMYAVSAVVDPTNISKIVLPRSIRNIGNSAFENLTSLKTVELKGKTRVGNRAFAGCRGLSNVEMVSTDVIGTEAFKDCTGLTKLVFPSSETTIIEPGAFAGCTGLATVDMSEVRQSLEIRRYAFYNCNSLNSVKFSQYTQLIAEGAFALHPDNQGGALSDMDFSVIEMQNFRFGDPNSARGNDTGEMMLAGRGNLLTCELPGTYGANQNVTLPDDFFKNCYMLKSVKVAGAMVNLTEAAFKNVKTVRNGLYIEGSSTWSPGSDIMAMGSFSNPRKTAHEIGLDYKFTETTGSQQGAYFEAAQVDQDETTLREITDYYMIQLNGGDPNAKEGVMSRYFPERADRTDETSAIVGGKNLVIRSTYGDGIRVTAITDGCFDLVKDRAETLTVGDGTVSSINANAFEDFSELTTVDLGDSVTAIGDQAFKDCNQLKDVTFRTQDNVTIGAESFTKDYSNPATVDGLTFHGKIAPSFTPFTWAMAASNDLTNAGTRILYENLFPTYVGALYDRGSSSADNPVVTAVYYPLYTSLDQDNKAYIEDQLELLKNKFPNMPAYDYSIINRVEHPEAPDWQMVDPNDISLAQATKNIEIPAGVTSIDTNAFYQTYLDRNIASITAYWTRNEIKAAVDQRQMTSRAAIRFASTNAVTSTITKPTVSGNSAVNAEIEVTSVPGLFSGYYEDYLDSDPDKAIYETNPNGNDRVETIKMSTVSSLPNYAFDSCERLNTVDLGAVQNFGIAPFRGCTHIENVSATGNDSIIVENDIIYRVYEEGKYELIECLPTRGNDGTMQEVSVANDPKLANVTSIKEEAFTGCEYILSVNLTGCDFIREIPANCFEGCTSLRRATMPASINEIGPGAFKDLDPIEVTIPAREVHIDKTAFKHGPDKNGNILPTVILRSYSDTAVERYADTNKITFVPYDENKHSVVFLNWDFEELYSTYVDHGMSVEDWLDEQELPTREGYKFTGWKSITPGASLRHIDADTTFVAQFEANTPNDPNNPGGNDPSNPGGNDPSNPGGNDPSNPGGNNPGGNDPNNPDNPGDKDDDDKKLYTVTVINGSGSGSYVEGATVVIAANNPPAGQKFKDWTVNTNNATLASNRVAATTFKMPSADVQVTANYEKDNSSGGSTVSGNGGSSNNNSSNRNNNGTKVVITRPGISDTDLAAATVNGSKDGFIVKISETAEATAAVEQALTNRYGSLDNIRYAAMDISLYDSTGTTKITDTTGYTIDITIPIPDALRLYAGNNKTAAVVSSQLEDLTPKFTTIDGVPCVTFRATHFSPYTVYVDTGNLTAGGLDSTPKTGDGIHPKWFLAIGLACLSVVLFMKKDKKAPKVKTA